MKSKFRNLHKVKFNFKEIDEGKGLEKEVKDLSEIYALRNRFKFIESLNEPIYRLKLVAEKEHPYFFIAFDQYQDSLLDDKENVLDAVKKFMNGAQKEIFENVLFYLDSNNANFNYIDKSGIGKLSLVKERPPLQRQFDAGSQNRIGGY